MVESPRFVVILDKTIFYPQGGGQPSDTGEIVCNITKNTFHVEFVTRTDSGIVEHYGYFEQQPLVDGSQVTCKINKNKREYHARIHSAGHLIDVAMLQCGIDLLATKGNHFPNLGPSVDYKGLIPADERAPLKAALEERVNNLIQQGIPTKVTYKTPKDAVQLCMEGQSPVGTDDQIFRIVVVGGDKGCPCGGTHVKNTREIKAIKIKKIAKKGDSMRVSYLVEE